MGGKVVQVIPNLKFKVSMRVWCTLDSVLRETFPEFNDNFRVAYEVANRIYERVFNDHIKWLYCEKKIHHEDVRLKIFDKNNSKYLLIVNRAGPDSGCTNLFHLTTNHKNKDVELIESYYL